MRMHWPTLRRTLSESLHEGTYEPGTIRRVWIPKAGGGQRGLGIPNVIDRVVAEAVRLVLEPVYEPTFHTSSHAPACQAASRLGVGRGEVAIRPSRKRKSIWKKDTNTWWISIWRISSIECITSD